MSADDAQPALFALEPPVLEAASPKPEHVALAQRLPESVFLGGMSWSYAGWIGQVYGAKVQPKRLSELGLTAYSKHPLLRTVEIDRTYYDPIAPSEFRAYAEQVPERFRFLAKAHEDCVVRRFPMHARYGKKAGEANPRFLDPAYAADAVVAPFREGLGSKAGALIFQFPPQDVRDAGAFAERLHGFLTKLPEGIVYAVELRNHELLTSDYAAVLDDAGAVHCHNVWTGMPTVLAQAKQLGPSTRRPLVVRWLMRQTDVYESALARYSPFDRIVDEDPANRSDVAHLAALAHHNGVPALVVVDNKAEGCAPESIARLAAAIADELGDERARGAQPEPQPLS
jgi:uncharacterized protein YecE (DUF72 family)